MNNKLTEVTKIKECETKEETNTYLKKGWILLYIFMDTQLCFSKVTVGPNNFTKIQPFDKVLKIYVIGKIEKND